MMEERKFYKIKDTFFQEMQDPYLKYNKSARRPHYYCYEDERTGIYWMIPLSSRVEKYRKIMAKRENERKSCDIIHIARLDNGRENAFLIQDMFPITEQYIEDEYRIAGNPLVLTSEHTAKIIEKKAKKVMHMLEHGVRFTPTQPDIFAILERLERKQQGKEQETK